MCYSELVDNAWSQNDKILRNLHGNRSYTGMNHRLLDLLQFLLNHISIRQEVLKPVSLRWLDQVEDSEVGSDNYRNTNKN